MTGCFSAVPVLALFSVVDYSCDSTRLLLARTCRIANQVVRDSQQQRAALSTPVVLAMVAACAAKSKKKLECDGDVDDDDDDEQLSDDDEAADGDGSESLPEKLRVRLHASQQPAMMGMLRRWLVDVRPRSDVERAAACVVASALIPAVAPAAAPSMVALKTYLLIAEHFERVFGSRSGSPDRRAAAACAMFGFEISPTPPRWVSGASRMQYCARDLFESDSFLPQRGGGRGAFQHELCACGAMLGCGSRFVTGSIFVESASGGVVQLVFTLTFGGARVNLEWSLSTTVDDVILSSRDPTRSLVIAAPSQLLANFSELLPPFDEEQQQQHCDPEDLESFFKVSKARVVSLSPRFAAVADAGDSTVAAAAAAAAAGAVATPFRQLERLFAVSRAGGDALRNACGIFFDQAKQRAKQCLVGVTTLCSVQDVTTTLMTPKGVYTSVSSTTVNVRRGDPLAYLDHQQEQFLGSFIRQNGTRIQFVLSSLPVGVLMAVVGE